MAKRKTAAAPTTAESDWGALAHLPQGTLRSCTIGALPILNHFFQRMHLEDILDAHLPHKDRRRKLPVARGLLVLIKNLLVPSLMCIAVLSV